MLIALGFRHFRDNALVENVFKGIRPAVVALILVPTFNMARTAKINRYTFWIPMVAALAIWLLGVSPLYVIMAGIMGGIVKYLVSDSKKGGES